MAQHGWNRWLATCLATFVAVLFSLSWTVPAFASASDPTAETQAAACAAALGGLTPNPAEGVCKSLGITGEKILKPTIGAVIMGFVANTVTYIGNRLAYEAALAITGGGPGQTPLFTSQPAAAAWTTFGQDVGADAIGELSQGLSDKLGIQFNLCAPPNPAISLNIALGLKAMHQVPVPKCDFASVQRNWASFVGSLDPRSGGDLNKRVLDAFAGSLNPGVNEMSAALKLNVDVLDKESQKKSAEFSKYLADSGFKGVTDVITGQVKTPAAFVQQATGETILNKDTGQRDMVLATVNNPDYLSSIGLSMLGTFSSTLLSNGILQQVYNGLFGATPPSNPFDNLTAPGSTSSPSPQLAEVNAVSPISVSSFNVLNEFIVCPSGTANRNIDNCVMDSPFLTAVARGNGGAPLTVQQAMDQGLLHADWTLISPNDPAKNQDPLCYTYGYCYGNLVKLREARVISVGWELAAAASSPDKPLTLGKVVDAFNKCQDNPTLCHLIDPNWILKYPQAQCRAQGNGELLSTTAGASRNVYCADVQNCVSERADGSCASYGYCTREKNTWKFQGTACPVQFASCLTFTDASAGGKTSSFLLNTVDYGTCSQQNAGCLWYAATQFLNNHGTPNVSSDDTWDWQDKGRAYFNGQVQQCSPSDDGCTTLIPANGVALNLVTNPGFENDKDKNKVPDAWVWTGATPGVYDVASGALGSAASVAPGVGLMQRGIALSANTVYTLSAYAKISAMTATTRAEISFTKADGVTVPDLSGTVSTCKRLPSATYGLVLSPSADFARVSCNFTTVGEPLLATITLGGDTPARFDDIQLEAGEATTRFTDGYNPAGTQATYLKVAPTYLGCTGAATDPAACAQYAGTCQAQDIGCNLYAPLAKGQTAIPATISDSDRCPSECVGYAAFKQVGTPYEPSPAAFASFIPSKATSCTAVGCDGFTNLNTVAKGGEGIEYYTGLRACSTPTDAGANGNTYFTWEGSDLAGYQLKTWQLYKSSLGAAPCTNWSVTNAGTAASARPIIQCNDVATANPDNAPTGCTSHDDILKNPDCREFYDQAGAIHYRYFSQTVTVSDACAPYRKTVSDAKTCGDTRGLWIGSNECRYLGLASESTSCPAVQNGCRAFTGASANNLQTIASQDFENTTASQLPQAVGAAVLTLSGESVATGGHSLSVKTVNLNEGFVTMGGTAAAPAPMFKGLITPGATFTVSFWAKGSGALNVAFVEKNGTVDSLDPVPPVQLDSSWRPYTFGPFDSAAIVNGAPAHPNFDDSAVIRVTQATVGTFFIDNFELKQTGAAFDVIKGSWVVPASCDTAPSGAADLQHYLGCQAYTDQKPADGTVNLFQFTRLCSEKAVGCQAFYNTQNSSADTGGKIYNMTCARGDGKAVTAAESCVVGNQTYCTIAAGQSSCFFDLDGVSFPTLTGVYLLKQGPEARVVYNDTTAYLVDNGTKSCTAAVAGCRGFGQPIYNNDRSKITSYQSVYLLDQPDQYAGPKGQLCTDSALFCKAWNTPANGQYFFKDPGTKQCEYKTGVRIDSGASYDGWFQQGTNKPCYANNKLAGSSFGIWRNGDTSYDDWVGSCPAANDRCTEFVDPSDTSATARGVSYTFVDNQALGQATIQGTKACNGQTSRKNGCALFDDTNVPDLTAASGPSYVFSTHADVLEAPGSTSPVGQADVPVDPIDCRTAQTWTEKVAGQPDVAVDLCAMRCRYDVGTQEQLTTPPFAQNTVPSDATGVYVGSCLTDTDCVGLKATDGQTRIGKCADPTKPMVITPTKTVTVAAADQPKLRASNDTNRVLNVARDRQCAEWLTCASSRASWNSATNKYDQICEQVQLCSAAEAGGTCTQPAFSSPNILSTGYYQGRDTSWSGQEYAGYSIPNQLPVDLYKNVSVSPSNQNKPVYTLGYVAGSCTPNKTCVGGTKAGTACDADAFCGQGGTCVEKLGESCRIGTCADTGASCSANANCNPGVSCVIGFCQKQSPPPGTCSNAPATVCTTNAPCVGGFCQHPGFCFSDNDCLVNGVAGSSPTGTPKCDTGLHLCVDHLVLDNTTTSCGNDTVCKDNTLPAGQLQPVCRYAQGTKVGGCYNGLCVTSIKDTKGTGIPDRLVAPGATLASQDESPNIMDLSCRTYPENDSPFPGRVVKNWKILKKDGSSGYASLTPSAVLTDAVAFVAATFTKGYETANLYGPATITDSQGNAAYQSYDGSSCTYQKVTYGSGAATRYYQADNVPSTVTQDKSICVGGPMEGKECTVATDCAQPGICTPKTKQQKEIGWDGYCLERDSSIQLYGQQSADSRPCLQWLPVDQLYNSTDIYAQFVDAGLPPQEKYYCAKTSLFYDVGTTPLACAETINNSDKAVVPSKNQPGHGQPGTSSWWDRNDCYKSVMCPPDYFGVVAPADTEASTDDAKGKDCTEGDNDCAYFCVPLLAFHDGDNSACYPPKTVNTAITPTGTPASGTQPIGVDVKRISIKDVQPASFFNEVFSGPPPSPFLSNYLIDVYVADGDAGSGGAPSMFSALRDAYKDCHTRGIPAPTDTIDDYALGNRFPGTSEQISAAVLGVNWNEGYYGGFETRETPYLGCKSVVKVASATPVQSPSVSNMQVYNQAWTDRVWETSADAGYTLDSSAWGSASSNPNFKLNVPPPIPAGGIFGQAADLSSYGGSVIDLGPERPAMCGAKLSAGGPPEGVQKNPDADGTCSSQTGSALTSPIHSYALYGTSLQCSPDQSALPVCTLDVYVSCEGILDTTASPNPYKCNYMTGDTTSVNLVYDQIQTQQCGGLMNTPTNTGPVVSIRPAAGSPKFCKIIVADSAISSDCNTLSDQLCATVTAGGKTQTYCNPTIDAPKTDSGYSCLSTAIRAVQQDLETPQRAMQRLSQIYGSSLDSFAWCPWGKDQTGGANYCTRSLTPYASGTGNAESTWLTYDWRLTAGGSNSFHTSTDGSFGTYQSIKDPVYDNSNADQTFTWTDPTQKGYGAVKPQPPIVRPVGQCTDGICLEGDPSLKAIANPSTYDNTFTVNNILSGPILGSSGTKHVTASFFAFADKNQMPLRQIVIDWGDSRSAATYNPNATSPKEMPLDLSTRGGSAAPADFYQNHRGRDGAGNAICGTTQSKETTAVPANDLASFGTSGNACDNSYVAFTHDYVCTPTIAASLTSAGRTCHFSGGKLVNSPCVGGGSEGPSGSKSSDCVFAPRINLTDNWGWCSGTCTGGLDGTPGCYGTDECDITDCPNSIGKSCRDGAKDNPWVNFGGYIIVSPAGSH